MPNLEQIKSLIREYSVLDKQVKALKNQEKEIKKDLSGIQEKILTFMEENKMDLIKSEHGEFAKITVKSYKSLKKEDFEKALKENNVSKPEQIAENLFSNREAKESVKLKKK